MDSCSGLNCHVTRCPTITHPLTGEMISLPSRAEEPEKKPIEGLTESTVLYLEMLKDLQMYKTDGETKKA